MKCPVIVKARTPLWCSLTFAFGLALSGAGTAYASGVASVYVSAGGGDDASDYELALTGTAHASVSGGRTFGANQSHLFLSSASANGNNGRIALATQQTTTRWNGQAAAYGQVFDTLTFFGSRTAEVEFTMNVNGGFFNAGAISQFEAEANLMIGGLAESALFVEWQSTPGSLVRYGRYGDVPFVGQSNEPEHIQATLRVRGLITPGTTVSVSSTVYLRTRPGYAGAIAHSLFDHTAQLSMTLPEGWTYTSESGTFLTEPIVPATSAPEPGSLALLALGGIGILGRAIRKRHQ
jgi:hypothetical protein